MTSQTATTPEPEPQSFIDRGRLVYSLLSAVPFTLGLAFTRNMPGSWRFLAHALAVAVFVVVGIRDALATGAIRIGTRRFAWRPLPLAWPLVAYLCWTIPPLIHYLINPDGESRWVYVAGTLVTLTVGLLFFAPIRPTTNPQR